MSISIAAFIVCKKTKLTQSRYFYFSEEGCQLFLWRENIFLDLHFQRVCFSFIFRTNVFENLDIQLTFNELCNGEREAISAKTEIKALLI